jgi:hypothetical protein
VDIRYAPDWLLGATRPPLAGLEGGHARVKVVTGAGPAFVIEYGCSQPAATFNGLYLATYAGPMPVDGYWHTIDLDGDGQPVWQLPGFAPQTLSQLMASCSGGSIHDYGFIANVAGSDAFVDDVSVAGLTTNFLVPPLERLAGADRRETACAMATYNYASPEDLVSYPPDYGTNPSRAPREAKAVVLVNDNQYADALAAGPLAALVDAPLLLNHGDTVRTTCDLMTLTKGDTVYLVGGTGVLSPALESAIKNRGLDVVRLGGSDRYATAVEVAQKIDALRPAGTPQQVFLASGTDFPDALSAGAPAGNASGAVLLTQGSRTAPATAAYLASRPDATVYAVGGPAAAAANLPTGNELVGADRYATATIVADRFFPEPTTAAFASGANYPDALAACAYGGNVGAPVLLVAPTAVPDVVAAFAARHRATLRGSVLLGGIGAVTNATFTRLSTALTPPR